MKRKFFAYPYSLWMAIFIIVPLLLIIYYAFTIDGVFSIDNLLRSFEPVYLSVMWRSIWMAALCTAICMLLGYPTAYILSRLGLKAGLLLMLIIVPMWMNFLLRTYAWMALLDTNGIINHFLQLLGLPKAKLMNNAEAIVLGLVYNYLPFMILPIYTVLSKIPKNLIEAAQDLGASSYTVFRKVTLPLSVPGLVSGITMVFMPAVSTFAVSRLLGGSNYSMLGDLIEQQFITIGDWGFGSALSFIMMIIILISMAVMQKADTLEEGGRLW